MLNYTSSTIILVQGVLLQGINELDEKLHSSVSNLAYVVAKDPRPVELGTTIIINKGDHGNINIIPFLTYTY